MSTIDSDDWSTLSALFDELSELDVAARESRLAALRAADPRRAERLDALLAADAAASGLLERSLDEVAPRLHESLLGREWETRAGQVFGRYRLVEPIGSGGMGEVWRAERADGEYRQDVALKLLKPGMDTQAILRRFLQERSILARLQHPGIVRLLDGGMGGDGRPYYVMDFVHGLSVSAHAAGARLDVRTRVAMVATIADAVGYAHAQLIVHRDIKPSNVIVDAEGVPHLLDFGIAKLLEDSVEQTGTGTGMRVLSPAYAAPEQIRGEAVGTATDVYALGVLLYELLTGHLPHRRRSRDPDVLAHSLASETIERPSVAAARGDTVVALYGHTDGRRLARELKGDLDLVLMTAMHADPRRRYATAAAFADDLRRWLEGRPVAARADSARYRAGKFVRRHRLGVAAAVAVVLALIGGLGAALWQAGVAREAALRADIERDLARQQAARAERVKEFVLALFREQDPTSRASVLARTPPQLIREGIAQVDATLATEPALQADLLRDLGEIQASLGEREAGKATLKRAWDLEASLSGADSAATAEALSAYATATMAAGDATAAEPLLRQAIATLEATRGAGHAKTAQAKAALARIVMIAGRDDEALALAEQARQVIIDTSGPNSPQVAPVMHLISVIEASLSRYDASLATAREALRIVEASSGVDHVRTITLHAQISDVLRNQRSFDESLQHLASALRIARANLPARHPSLGAILTRQGDQLRRMRRFEEAEAAFAEAVSILAGSRSAELGQIMQNYGTLAVAQGRTDLAIARYRESVDLFRQSSGESTFTWLTTLLLADAMATAGSLDQAARLADEASAALAPTATPDTYASAFAANIVGRMRYRQGRPAEAVDLHRRALDVIARSYGEDHVETAETRVMLARCLAASRDAGARAEAQSLVNTALPIIEVAINKQALLAEVLLVRAQLRLDAGDARGARGDIDRAEDAFATDISDRPAQQRRARQLRQRLPALS